MLAVKAVTESRPASDSSRLCRIRYFGSPAAEVCCTCRRCGGAGGAKGGDQEEREPAKHALDTGLGSRDTGARRRTASRTCDLPSTTRGRTVCLNWARTGPCGGGEQSPSLPRSHPALA